MIRRLPRGFFERESVDVAPDLLGRILVRNLPSGERIAVRIVETEAYGPDDPASHSFRGPTARNAVMFGQPGHLYLYFVYGMHWCANIVTGPPGRGSAVLLRAGKPLVGVEAMERLRGGKTPLAAGPARLAQALGLDGDDNGTDLCSRSSGSWIEQGSPVDGAGVARGSRVGLRLATEVPWRFWERGSGFVSGSTRFNLREAPRKP